MKIKSVLLILILILANFNVTAAVKFVQGRIIDSKNEPVIYASVSLLKDGKVESGCMSDTLGIFKLTGNFQGNYNIRISSIGYNNTEIDIDSTSGNSLNIGDIILTESATLLNTVTITANVSPKSVNIEKTSINPNAGVSAATGSVLDALRSSSSVSIDNDNNVAIRGNSNVLILVDGVPTTLGGLSSIPSANVKSIEIVTSPDVKYDSEGTGGIINIVSKKQSSSALNAMASFNYGSNDFLNGNFAVGFKSKRFGVRLNYNGKSERDIIHSELHRTMHSTGNALYQDISAVKKTTGQTVGLNVNFTASPRNILTLDLKASFPRINNFQNFNNHYNRGGNLSDLFRQTDITFNRENYEGGLTYKHIFIPDKRELSFNLNFSSITGHRPSFYYENMTMVQRSTSGGAPYNYSLQVDYMTHWGKGVFEAGAKMTIRSNNIDHKLFQLNTETNEWELSMPLSNDLSHREYIPAAYSMYSIPFTKRLRFKGGLRMEYSYVSLRSHKEQIHHHSDCFFIAPNVNLNFQINSKWSLDFVLSRRISRPTYPQLNPYINLIDNDTYETGNMNLKPEKSNKADFGYSFATSDVNIHGNAYFNYTTDNITQVATLDNNGLLIMTYINGSHDMKIGIDHNVRLTLLSWLTTDLSSNTFYTSTRGNYIGANVDNNGWSNNSNVSLTFRLLKGMTLQAQYFVETPIYYPQFTTSTVNYCNLSLRQSFLKGALTATALLTDVFNTRHWDIHSNNNVYNLFNNSKNKSRMLWFGLTYNFNSFKPIGKKQSHSEEHRSRFHLGE